MRAAFPAVLLLSLAGLLILPACSTMPPQDADQAQRLRLHADKSGRLELQTAWSLSGKLAISNDRDGGSGRFNWHKNSQSSRMDFHGALGRGAWRLDADGAGARLEQADGTVHQASSVEHLIQSQVGWKLPVNHLAWWVRGLTAPGDLEEQELDAQGNLVRLVQDGWTIVFARYRDFDGFDLPLRVTASQADWKVKLVVSSWTLAGEPGSDG